MQHGATLRAEDKQEAGENAESRLTESQHAAENKEKYGTKGEREREDEVSVIKRDWEKERERERGAWIKGNFLCKGKAHHVFAHIKYERDYAL